MVFSVPILYKFILQAIVEAFAPLTVPRILLLQALRDILNVAVVHAVHAAVCLVHERLQDPLVLDGFCGEDDLDKFLRRDAMQLQITRESFHYAPELNLGIRFDRHFGFYLMKSVKR